MLLTLFSCTAFADDERDAAILADLLKLSSPAPDRRELLKQADPARDGVPPPDADLATLADFWRYAPTKMQPDRSVPARLLELPGPTPFDRSSRGSASRNGPTSLPASFRVCASSRASIALTCRRASRA